MKNLLLLAALLLASCMRIRDRTQEDVSIKFPNFHERFATVMGDQGQPYVLDGETLRAITIAANDFIPSSRRNRECWEKQEAHRYQVIRQGDIIFVEISPDTKACARIVIPLDGGVKYAISRDGRILRRLFDGEPEDSSPDFHEAADEQRVTGGSYFPASKVGGVWAETAPALPSSWFDGGIRPSSLVPGAPDAGSPIPDGGIQAPDGGMQLQDDGSRGVPSADSRPDAG